MTVLRNVSLDKGVHVLGRGGAEAAAWATCEDHALQAPDRYEEGFTEGKRQAELAARGEIDRARKALGAEVHEAKRLAVEAGRSEGLVAAEREAMTARSETEAQLRRESQSRLNGVVKRLEQIAIGVSNARAEVLSHAQDDLVALVHETVARMIGAHAAEPRTIAALVRDLVETHRVEPGAQFHVHPADAQLLRDNEVDGAWVPDPTVTLGGVLIRTQSGSIDARFETQLGELGRTLQRVRNQRPALGRAQA